MKVIVVKQKNTDGGLAESLALRLNSVVHGDGPQISDAFTHVLWTGPDGLALSSANGNAGTATRVDFMDATLHYRLRTSGKRQGIGKAVGLDKKAGISVLDATAGLGRDALVMAYLGCHVQMLEHSPVIHALLEDGLQRARTGNDATIKDALERMELYHYDARRWFADIASGARPKPEVVYLDPMFPLRTKSANVKKDIAMLQSALNTEHDFAGLLDAARQSATHRVVVKRPGNKPGKDVPEPSFTVSGKSAHFEVYVNSSFSSMR
jgi:16S rRNA (guanine1516-N2)-methyltransferase